MWFKYGLKAQKLLAQGIARKQHALKGQKLLAQGIALGYYVRKLVALKGQKLLLLSAKWTLVLDFAVICHV